MPSAALLRKTMLSVLQHQILPDLQKKSAHCVMMARLPLNTPAGITVREMPHAPLLETDAEKTYPQGKKWKAVGMHSVRIPALYCVIEGEADLAMGITPAMLGHSGDKRPQENQCGGYIFSLPAPAYFLVPPGVPQRTSPPWNREKPHVGKLCLFVVRVLPVGALCTMTTMQDAVYQVQYSLLVKDDQIAAVTEILVDELNTASPDAQIIQAQLLTLMLRLKRGLNREIPLMTDGLYSRFPDTDPADLLHHPLIERAHEYIQLHLHELLSPSAIAAHVQVTPDHLNRIFKAHIGISTMSYVTRLRMETAQLLLNTSDLSVQEISCVVGYRQLPHFSRTFHSHTGKTPLRFRQQREPMVEDEA